MTKSMLLATCMAVVGVCAEERTVSIGSCIISGSLDRSCATEDYASCDDFDLRAYAADFGSALESFESRFRTHDFGDPLSRFHSDEPQGFFILFR